MSVDFVVVVVVISLFLFIRIVTVLDWHTYVHIKIDMHTYIHICTYVYTCTLYTYLFLCTHAYTYIGVRTAERLYVLKSPDVALGAWYLESNLQACLDSDSCITPNAP